MWLYEMEFLVQNYSCLQNSWLGGYRPQVPVLSVLFPQLNLLSPPNKIPGYATEHYQQTTLIWSSTTLPPYNRTHTPRTFTDSATLWKNVLPLSSVQKNATITICEWLKNVPLFTNHWMPIDSTSWTICIVLQMRYTSKLRNARA